MAYCAEYWSSEPRSATSPRGWIDDGNDNGSGNGNGNGTAEKEKRKQRGERREKREEKREEKLQLQVQIRAKVVVLGGDHSVSLFFCQSGYSFIMQLCNFAALQLCSFSWRISYHVLSPCPIDD